MSIIVFDQGMRIQTPLKSILPDTGIVASVSKPRNIHRSADMEDELHTDGEKFNLPDTPKKPVRFSSPGNAAQAYRVTAAKAQPQTDRRKLTVSHLMSRPVYSVTPETTIHAAWQLMTAQEVSHLVVVDEENHPIGLLSERDVVIAGTDSFHQVETIYQDQFFAAEENTLIRQIAVTIIENNINAVPIIDDEDQVIGIICRTDLLRLLISGSNLEGWA